MHPEQSTIKSPHLLSKWDRVIVTERKKEKSRETDQQTERWQRDRESGIVIGDGKSVI